MLTQLCYGQPEIPSFPLCYFVNIGPSRRAKLPPTHPSPTYPEHSHKKMVTVASSDSLMLKMEAAMHGLQRPVSWGLQELRRGMRMRSAGSTPAALRVEERGFGVGACGASEI